MSILNLMKMAERSPKQLKTLWGKRENAHYEQFLIFSQKTCTADTLKSGLVFGRVEPGDKKMERRKYWLPLFSFFPTMFSKTFSEEFLKFGIIGKILIN